MQIFGRIIKMLISFRVKVFDIINNFFQTVSAKSKSPASIRMLGVNIRPPNSIY